MKDPEAVDELITRLEGKTIVSADLDVEGSGFHFTLDDGNVLVVAGTYIIGIYKPQDETLQ